MDNLLRRSWVLSVVKTFYTTRSLCQVKFSATSELIQLVRTADAVCFDVDSTVIPYEGIDKLADYKGVGQLVAEYTRKAMGGEVKFQDALKARLDLIQPSRQDIKNLLKADPVKLTEGVKDVIDLFHERGSIVYLVSGGFRQMIEPVANLLNIPNHRIYANDLLFHQDKDRFDQYKDFDPTEPTSQDGGKAAVLHQLITMNGYKNIVMIGDGATDMQARPPASVFIGYGGIVTRKAVQEGSDWFLTNFQRFELLKQDLAKVLKNKD